MTRNRKAQTNDIVKKADREGDLYNHHRVFGKTKIIIQFLQFFTGHNHIG